MDTVSMLNKMSFYCQPILPLVYDESMSYYETLCKVVGQLNTTGDAVNKLNEGLTGEIADRQKADSLLDERLKVLEATNNKIHFLVFAGTPPHGAELIGTAPTRSELRQWVNNHDLIITLLETTNGEHNVVYAASCTYNAENWSDESSDGFNIIVPISTSYDSEGDYAVRQKIAKITIPPATASSLDEEWGLQVIEINTPSTSANGVVNFAANIFQDGHMECNLTPFEFMNLYAPTWANRNLCVAVNAKLFYDGYTRTSSIATLNSSNHIIRIAFERDYGTFINNGVKQLNKTLDYIIGDVSHNTWTHESIDSKVFDFTRYEGFQFTRGENNVITANDESTPNAVYAQYHSDTSGKIYQNLPVRLVDTVDNAEYWNGVFGIKDDRHMTFTFVTSNYVTASGKMAVRVIELSADVDTTTWKYAEKEFELPISSSGEKYLVESTAISEGVYDAVRKKTDYYLTFNKTNNEIIAALNSGKDIQFKVTLTEGNETYPVYFSTGYTRVDVFNNVPVYMFVGSFGDLDHSVITVYGVTDSSETFRPYLTTTGGILPEPNPDDSDDGKVLMVNKHKWEIKKLLSDGAAINVKDFGAKGDGVTDDTTAVQNALNAAQGKTLIIDGVCKITAPLTVKDNTEIIGAGSRASGFDSYVAGTLFTSANNKGIYQCLFKNLRLRNRNLSPTDADGQYIGQVFSNIYESRVTECYVEHFAQICSKMARTSSIDNCKIYYVNKSLVNDVIDSMIESNYINAKNTAADRTIMVYGLFSNSMFANNFCDYWGTSFRLEPGSKPSNVIGNTFDNCVSVFRDYVVGLSIVGNNYTNIKYVSANWQAGGQPSEAIQATKWSVFKFDGATSSHTDASTHCSLLDTTFNSNTFGNCSYYIDVENGISVYPVKRCKFSDNAWEGLLVDAGFTNPQSAYDNGGMRTVYFDFWEGQSVDVLPPANLVSDLAKSIFVYDGLKLWYKKREIINFNGAWRFADGSVLSKEIWDLADRTYLSRTVKANTPRTYSMEHWYKVGFNGAEYTDAGYAGNPIISNISKNGFTIQTKNTMAGLGFYLPYGKFTFTATLPTGIEAYLLVVPKSGTLTSRDQVESGNTLNCGDTSKSYVLLFCSRTTPGTYTVSNISIMDNSYTEVSTAPYYSKEVSQTKSIADTAGYYTSDTVEGALAEIGGTLAELKAAINTIRGVS